MRGGRVAVVGGSIAGCAAALAAHRGGADEVTVYERAAGGLAERGVGTDGRVLLAGDAAAVARPHTGAGAVKALQDATVLESALATADTWADALDTYDTDRTVSGRAMVDLGRRLGGALVRATPDWRAMDQSAMEAWWRRADGSGAFGGRRLGN